MALIKCPECKKKISSDCTSCPKCGANMEKAKGRQKKGASITLVIFLLFLAACYAVSMTARKNPDAVDANSENDSTISETESTPITIIDDVVRYSRITSDELISELGDPTSIEDWKSATSNGEFDITNYSYDLNSMHYDFMIADGTIVKVMIFSQNYWQGEGERFSYSDKEMIPEMFGVQLEKHARIVADNNLTYRISPVSSTVAEINIQDMKQEDNTFGLVSITYNLNYFN